MNLGWLKSRQTKYSSYASVYILVIVAVLAAANWLANRYTKSYDTTSNKRFSLSDQTEKVAKNLQQDVRITYYDRTESFGPARDLLERYDNLSTRLSVDYQDPVKKPSLARAAGVRSVPTIYVQAGQKREEAKSLTEEEVTGAIIRAIKTGDRNVCFVTGSGEHSISDEGPRGFARLKALVEKNNYKTREISLLEKAEVPKDCTILVIGGPDRDYIEPAVNAVRSYVDNGGRVLLMLDPPLGFGKREAAENAALVKLAESWGVTLNKDLALDTSGVGQLFGLGPEMPLATNYESHAIVREMKGTASIFPISRTVDAKPADKGSAEKLLSTSDNSYATTALDSPDINLDPKRDKKGPLALAAAGTWRGAQQGRFVVVGGSGWASNNFLPARSFGNSDLLMNMMNWLSSDEDLIAIRPKDPEDRRLTLNRAQMGNIMLSSLLILPLAVVAGGFMVWWRRR